MEETLSLAESLYSNLPANSYERVLKMQEIKKELSQFLIEIDCAIHDELESLANTEDDQYKVVPYFLSKKKSTLNLEKFEQELPEEYDRSLSIKASEAEKVLGKDVLREMVIEKIGWDNFVEIADVTLTEARKNIPKKLQPDYIVESYEQAGWEVVKK